MKNKNSIIIILISLFLGFNPFDIRAQNQTNIKKVRVSLEKREASDLDPGSFIVSNNIQEWNANETAIISSAGKSVKFNYHESAYFRRIQ